MAKVQFKRGESMTRRDTIIIAVFVNAAILIALFISAVRSKSSEKESMSPLAESSSHVIEAPASKTETAVAKTLLPTSEVKSAEGDEVDLVLKQFAQSATQLAAATQNRAVPTEVPGANPTAAQTQFSQDLQAFMLPQQGASQTAAPQASSLTELATSGLSSIIEVTIRKGDALEKIARAHRTTVKEIMKLNGLKNANLRIGQVLKVAVGTKGRAPSSKESAKETGVARYYTVKNGDNPWTIAVKNHLKVEELLRLNDMDEGMARRLKPGDQLRIE